MKLIQNNQRSRGSEVETNNFSIIPLINWQRMRAEPGVKHNQTPAILLIKLTMLKINCVINGIFWREKNSLLFNLDGDI